MRAAVSNVLFHGRKASLILVRARSSRVVLVCFSRRPPTFDPQPRARGASDHTTAVHCSFVASPREWQKLQRVHLFGLSATKSQCRLEVASVVASARTTRALALDQEEVVVVVGLERQVQEEVSQCRALSFCRHAHQKEEKNVLHTGIVSIFGVSRNNTRLTQVLV